MLYFSKTFFSILLSVELFLAHGCANWEFHFKPNSFFITGLPVKTENHCLSLAALFSASES